MLPHILFVVMDDLGSDDLGMHGSSGIDTPAADSLAGSGIYLDNYYVLPYCSPTRAAILSGRYPLHTGCHTIIQYSDTQGLPLAEETLPAVLRKGGYRAHAVGKWHVGHSRWNQTPTFRGFQSFFGYYLGMGDYYNHTWGGPESGHADVLLHDLRWERNEWCGEGCSVVADERGNYSTHIFTREAIRIIHEHHSNNKLKRNKRSRKNKASCVEEDGGGADECDSGDFGDAETGDETHDHGDGNNNEDAPLFLYLAHQAVHEPDQVPDRYRKQYENRTGWSEVRKTYAAMLTAADESLAQVIAALEEENMWNDTLVVYTTDNGGPTQVCGVQGSTNRPTLRGGKCTVWEGGTTGDAFLSGPALHRILLRLDGSDSGDEEEEDGGGDRGRRRSSPRLVSTTATTAVRRYPHIFHAVDWLPTLARIAGATPAGKTLDGVDQLDGLRAFLLRHEQRDGDGESGSFPANNEEGAPPPPPREEVFVGYSHFSGVWYGPAVRWRNWKLLQGTSGGSEREGDVPPGPRWPARGGDAKSNYLLFDLDTDPGEQHDLADKLPIVVQILQAKLKQYQETFVPPIQNDPNCPFYGATNTSDIGPTLRPWCSELHVYT
jgi:arylsulfatase A-like enzyme